MRRRPVAQLVRQRAGRRRATGAASTADHADQADHEVRAVVEAKLLGIRLLSLKAHVVTGRPTALAELTRVATLTSLPVADESLLIVDPPSSNGRSDALSEAIELLDQSSTTLHGLRD